MILKAWPAARAGVALAAMAMVLTGTCPSFAQDSPGTADDLRRITIEALGGELAEPPDLPMLPENQEEGGKKGAGQNPAADDDGGRKEAPGPVSENEALAPKAHTLVGIIHQPAAKNREKADIHKIRCRGQQDIFYIYQYDRGENKPNFRAIRPPEWGAPIGGRDYETYADAVCAACRCVRRLPVDGKPE